MQEARESIVAGSRSTIMTGLTAESKITPPHEASMAFAAVLKPEAPTV